MPDNHHGVDEGEPRMTARYEVLTWGSEKDEFTPQKGVRRGPYSLWGLRKALRKLQEHGYPCHRQDFFVLVQRIDPGYSEELRASLARAFGRATR